MDTFVDGNLFLSCVVSNSITMLFTILAFVVCIKRRNEQIGLAQQQ